jgi:hypothetical protein
MAQTAAFPVFVIVCVLADNGALHGAGEWGEMTPAPWQKALFRQEGALPPPVKLVPWQDWQKANPAWLPGADLAPAPCASGFAHPVGWNPAGNGSWQLWQNGWGMFPKVLLVSWQEMHTEFTTLSVKNTVCPVICPWMKVDPAGTRCPSIEKWQSRQMNPGGSDGLAGSWHAVQARLLMSAPFSKADPWKVVPPLSSQFSG